MLASARNGHCRLEPVAFGAMVTPGTSGRRVAGRYELRGQLGEGGMGIIWRAEDLRLGRPVAIKEIELPPAVSDQQRARLRARVSREARAAAQLNHPGAVTVYDVVSDDGQDYIVMELVDAPTLTELVRERGPLEPRAAAALGLRLLATLRAAHEAGIVHRDVKPSNVMVRPDGSTKLADFGVASLAGDPTITATGLVMGSPPYMAPEQATGAAVGPATDLWSLGATLYVAVEGVPPFGPGPQLQVLEAVASKPPRRGRRLGPLAPVLAALLTKDPARRPCHDELRVMLRWVALGGDATSGTAPAAPASQPQAQPQAQPPPALPRHEAAADAGADAGSEHGRTERLLRRVQAASRRLRYARLPDPAQRRRAATMPRQRQRQSDGDGQGQGEAGRSGSGSTASQERRTESGIPLKVCYRPEDLAEAGFDPATALGEPGEPPFTRGIYPTMYRGRVWTMRQYAGYGTAAETNARFRYLLERGQTGLSVAFDLPTQMGYDSDHPMATAEVGRTGVAIDSLADMRRLFEGIPLDKVSTSMTINAPAAVLLLLYQLVGEEQGVDPAELRGTVQNDVLKEYIARGTYIYPPAPSLRICTDLFTYCAEHLPRFNTISISGYHMAEAGATAVQEVAFTLSNAIAYVQAALDAGLEIDRFASRLSFFFVARTSLFEEVAKFRAARRIWSEVMATRFGAKDPRSRMLRFHTQTAGVQLTAQQPLNNVVRVALQGLAAVLGGTQSLHANAYDEALALPTEHAARLALRTQQILASEAGLTDTVDPLGGSYFIERLTDELEARARALMDEVEALGGAVAAIERSFQKERIERSAYEQLRAVERGDRVVVGVNRYTEDDEEPIQLLHLDPAIAKAQAESLAKIRVQRDNRAVRAALADLRDAAQGSDNLLVPMREALRRLATLGEVCDTLRDVFGVYRPPDTL